MNKKKIFLIYLIAVLIAVIGGAGAYFGIAYIQNGGTVEGALDYIEVTVIPALVNAGVFVSMAYIASKPIINNVVKIVNAFKEAKDDVNAVSTNSTATNEKVDKLATRIDEREALLLEDNKRMREELEKTRREFTSVKAAIKIAFTNTAELVRNGYAKQIVKVMEEEDEKTES